MGVVRRANLLIVAASFALTMVLSSVISPLSVSAAVDDCTWTGLGVNENWSTSGNWNCVIDGAAAVPGNNDNLIFPAGPSVLSTINDIVGLTVDNVNFTGSNYTINGNTFTIGDGAGSSNFTFSPGTTGNTINASLATNAENFNFQIRGGSHVIAGDIAHNTPGIFGTFFEKSGGDATASLLLSGTQSGTIGFVYRVIGTGLTVTLTEANTFTASTGVTVESGNFVCQNSSCFGDPSNNLFQFDTGRFMFNGADYTIPQDITLNTSNLGTATSLFTNSNNITTFTGSVTANGSTGFATQAGGDLVFSGGFNTGAGFNITAGGSGGSGDTLRFITNPITGSSSISCSFMACGFDVSSPTYAGSIIAAEQSRLTVTAVDGLGSDAGNTTVEDDATLEFDFAVPSTVNEQITVSGTGRNLVGGALLSSNGDTTIVGTVDLIGDSTFAASNSSILNLNGIISGTGDITLSTPSSGSFGFGGASANTYVGSTTVSGTALVLSKTANITAVTGDLIVAATSGSAAGVSVDATEQIADSANVTLTSNGANDANFGIPNADTETVNQLNGDGTVTLLSASSNLRVNGGNFSGEITGSGNFVKNSGDTTVLSGVSTFTGTTTVNDGVLVVNGSTAGSTLNVLGGTLKGSGTVGPVNAIGGTIAPGNSPGILNVAGNITLSSAATFQQEIAGAAAGTQYDQLIATGAVNLNNAILSIVPTYTPSSGAVFTIMTGASVTGTFAGLPEGSLVTSSGLTFRVNYTATSVTLTYVSGTVTAPTTTTLAETGVPAAIALIAVLLMASSFYIVRRGHGARV